MKILFLGDFWLGLEPLTEFVYELNREVEHNPLVKNNYGNSVAEIFPLLFFRPGNFKQRIRFIKKEKVLYADIMFDYKQALSLVDENDLVQMKYIVGENLMTLIPIIEKYKFPDFDIEKFEQDWKKFLENNNFLLKVQL